MFDTNLQRLVDISKEEADYLRSIIPTIKAGKIEMATGYSLGFDPMNGDGILCKFKQPIYHPNGIDGVIYEILDIALLTHRQKNNWNVKEKDTVYLQGITDEEANICNTVIPKIRPQGLVIAKNGEYKIRLKEESGRGVLCKHGEQIYHPDAIDMMIYEVLEKEILHLRNGTQKTVKHLLFE